MIVKLFKSALVLLAVLALGVGVSGFGVYRAAQHHPEFYDRALQAEPLVQAEAGDALEKSVLDLHNEARQEGRWQAVFTEEQLNGWLASDLSERFPSLLPPGAKDPRVDIAPDYAQVACGYERGKLNTVISFALDVALTEEPNQLAIRVFKVRAGALPVPLKRFLDRISRAATKADIDLAWRQNEGDPVALVTVPVRHEDYAHREIYVETLEFREGEMYLSGRTEELPEKLLARHQSAYPSDENRTVQ